MYSARQEEQRERVRRGVFVQRVNENRGCTPLLVPALVLSENSIRPGLTGSPDTAELGKRAGREADTAFGSNADLRWAALRLLSCRAGGTADQSGMFRGKAGADWITVIKLEKDKHPWRQETV